MFRLSLVFIPGMIVAILTGIPMVAWLAAFFLALVISVGFLYFHLRQFRALIVLALAFFCGGLLAASHQILNTTQTLNSTYGSPYTGVITKIATTANGHKATLLLLQHQEAKSLQFPPQPAMPYEIILKETVPEKNIPRKTKPQQGQSSGAHFINGLIPPYKILAFFSGSGDQISIGDTIIFTKSIERIPVPQSDFEFNASRYYSSLGIYHRVFLRVGEFTHVAFHGFSWSRSSDKLRKVISSKISERLPHQGSAAIMIAMLIGDKSNISSELKTSYSKSGSIHVLAISGLHIGIVATILIGIIGLPMPQTSRALAIAKATTVLSGIWLFTWISGMSPSATRAAFMFTIYLTGILVMRKAQILNILGFTAIFLLIREPFLLHNLGFQLSFLALTGIVIWGMPLLRAISFQYRILQYAWSVLAISLGAQILVAPAILYYFNEISIVSPVTSLIAIPAAYLIVFGGIVMLISEMIAPAIGSFIGSILSHGINLMNKLFTGFSEMPLSTLNDIYITSIEVAILACIIMLASFRLLTTRKVWLTLMIPFSFIFGIYHCHIYLQKTRNPHLTIYMNKSELACDVISASLTQTTLNPAQTDYYTLQDARRNRIQYYTGAAYRIIDYPINSESSNFSIKVITENSAPFYIMYLGSDLKQFDFRPEQFSIIILAKGLDYRAARRLKAQYELQNRVVHDMRRQGAFKLLLS